MAFGVVAGDGGGQLLEQHRLAGLGRRDDQAALALADRRDQVDETGGGTARRVFEPQPLARVQRGQVMEVRAAAQLLGRAAVDPLDLGQGALLAAYAFDEIALAQAVTADQRGRDLKVGGPRGTGSRPADAPARSK